MRPQYSITQQPAAEPITIDQASEHLRVDSTDDISYIASLIPVAREYADSITGRVSAGTRLLLAGDSWCNLSDGNLGMIPIFRTPLISVESVSYYAPDATELTVMDSADYRVILSTEPGMVQITGDFPETDTRPDAIQIEFTAGDCRATSAIQKHSIKMLVAHLYENRLPISFASFTSLPYSLDTLLENQRIGGWF